MHASLASNPSLRTKNKVPTTKGYDAKGAFGFVILQSSFVPQLVFATYVVCPQGGMDERLDKVPAFWGLWHQRHYFRVCVVITPSAYGHGHGGGSWTVIFPPLGWAALRGEAVSGIVRGVHGPKKVSLLTSLF